MTFVFPGGSSNNKAWVDKTKAFLEPATAIYWRHWESSEKESNWLDAETGRVLLKIGDQQINIIAKSIGTAVALKILAKIPGQINKLILNGIPINDFYPGDEEIYRPLASFDTTRTLVFQNETDPHGSTSQIHDFLQKINSNIKIIDKSRGDHEYPYYEEFATFLTAQGAPLVLPTS